ncbi:synaptotagmin-like protein 2 isoform X1 [Gymnodraco acuticeps]|uniref:Synaptotagmin-like protein 2 n=2 Tax=Gymnodraco acuticeps TaxID=8218 RepID=A0A6P8T404_GYMAC|nr:synaptotagmin-like protein 2 isoform X1 [Gymnodraco acuticeps]XP_034058330.1 synaptotagmin-like protein 2 isoform X1 [Gymnodraco acuticeps]
MIDLSFLTEEEQDAILGVLRRDTELKKAEEQRVLNLQKMVNDRGQLRYMTGEWFYEIKQFRHQDRIHGSEIIRASMRHSHRPLTILELVPPVICGLLQEPPMQPSSDRCENQKSFETPRSLLQSPTKQRKNPFNSEVIACHTFEEKDGQLLVAAVDDTHTLNQESSSSFESRVSYASSPNDSLITQNASVLIAMPEHRTFSICSHDCSVEEDGPWAQQNNSAALRGILKHLSLCSPADPLLSPLDPPAEAWIDRKQVRFSPTVGRHDVEWLQGKELGEHSLLDIDSNTPCHTENNSDLEKSGGTAVGPCMPSLYQSKVDLQEGELSCKNEANLQKQEAGQQVLGDVSEQNHSEFVSPAVTTLISAGPPSQATDWHHGFHNHPQKMPEQKTDIAVEETQDTKPSTGSSKGSFNSVSPKPRQRLPGLFRREKEKTDEVKTGQKEEAKIPQQKEQCRTKNLSPRAADMTVDEPASVKQEAKATETTEVRTLQLTALQNTPFKESVPSADADNQREAAEGRFVELPERLYNLKAFWERENTGPKVIISGEECKDIPNEGIDDLIGHKSNIDEKSINNNLSNQMEMTVKDAVSTSPQTNCVDLSKEDGTYRANPVLIDEETDDSQTSSLMESQISEPQRNIISPVTSNVSFKTRKQQPDFPDPLPRQSSSSRQEEDRPAKSSEVKDLWKKEYKEHRVVAARANSTVVAQSTPHQYQEKDETEYEERPLSPIKSQNERSKDQDDEIRKSPSKTCHPRVLPRESSIPQRSKLGGPQLTTFPIDIDPQAKVVEEQHKKPVPRQKKSPSHEAKHTVPTDSKSSIEVSSCPLPLPPEDVHTQLSSLSSFTSPLSKKVPEKKLGTFTCLARSFIPQDYQHYLGPQEKAHVPLFKQETSAVAKNDAGDKPKDALTHFSPTEGSPHKVNSWRVQTKEDNSSQNTATRAWSLSRASQGSYGDASSPVIAALKRLSSRSMSSSKSLENLSSQTSCSLPPSASTLPSSEQMRGSVSVTALKNHQTDSDTFETNFGWRRNTGSSTSNLSLSSGMASMSSVGGSTSSICPADFEVQGSIQFAVNYIQKSGEFHIFVVHCRDLAVADSKKNSSDPYVKCYLLPDKTKLGKRKTAVKNKTLNPTYNEILRYNIIMGGLKTQSLNISVWHNNTFGRNSFLGEVDLDLSEWDFSNTHINEYALKARVSAQSPASFPGQQADSRGQMRVALRFLPQTSHRKRTSRMATGEVQIWVKDCKNLPPVRGVIIDPFVKCTVLPDTSQKISQKTRVVKRTANPMFNHTMVYDGFRPEDLREACVEITVWDHDRLNNHHIGGLRLGLGTGKSYGTEVLWMDSTPDEADLWQRMLQSDGEWVEDVLSLRKLVMAKSMSK